MELSDKNEFIKYNSTYKSNKSFIFFNQLCKGKSVRKIINCLRLVLTISTFIGQRLKKAMECHYSGKQFSVARDITGWDVIVAMYQTFDNSPVKWPVRKREWKRRQKGRRRISKFGRLGKRQIFLC